MNRFGAHLLITSTVNSKRTVNVPTSATYGSGTTTRKAKQMFYYHPLLYHPSFYFPSVHPHRVFIHTVIHSIFNHPTLSPDTRLYLFTHAPTRCMWQKKKGNPHSSFAHTWVHSAQPPLIKTIRAWYKTTCMSSSAGAHILVDKRALLLDNKSGRVCMCGSEEKCKWRAIGINNQWKNGLCCMYFWFL